MRGRLAIALSVVRRALSLARDRIKARRQQHVLAAYIEEFRGRNRARTTCAPGYRVPECG